MSASTILTSKRTISAVVCSLSLAAMAATPVVVWDGDFGTSVKTGTDGKTYTLTLPSNVSVVDGCLSVGSGNQGASVSISPEYGRNEARLSVLMEYEGATAKDTAVPVYLEAEAYFGLKTKGESLDVLGDFWGTTYPTDSDPAITTTMPGAGYLLFVFPQGGVQAYSAATRAGLTEASAGGSIAGLSFSNKPLDKIGLGGTATAKNELNAFDGLIIKKVAIFTSAITAADAAEYLFPSEVQTITVSSSTTVSAINALFDSTAYKAAAVSAASGVTITVDTAFGEKIKSVSSTGSITLTADAQPDLSGVSFDVQGALLRSWLTPGVVGVNFHKAQGNVVSDELVTSGSWVATTGANGTSTDLFADGLTKVTWSAGGTYSYYAADNESVSFLHGYLDDGANKGNGVEIYIDNVPYETYDVVIYASTDTSRVKFRAKTVNGTAYTATMSGVVSAGNADWGASRLETPLYGVNAMRIKNLSGKLTILGGTHNGNRGGIAAIQIMPTTAEDKPEAEYTLELNGAGTKWSEGAWKIGESAVAAPLSGIARVTLSASTTLTVDDTVALDHLVIDGLDNAVLTIVLDDGSSLVSYSSVDVVGGVLRQGTAAVIGNTPQLIVEDGGTFDMNGLGINASTKVYLAGAGAGNWPWALTSSGGAGGAILGGLYLSSNATIGGANELKVGQTGAGYNCYLQGFTLTKTGAGALTGTNMNTPGTGTIDMQGGAMSVNQWNNLNSASGDTTVILNAGTSLANSTDRIISMAALGLYGGTLTTTRAFKVKTALRGAGETANLAFASGASASLTGDLTVTATLTLDGNATFLKDPEAATDVVVTPTTLAAASGTITVGSGVTLNVGVNRPTATITVQEGGTLAVQLQSASDVIALSTSAQPANLTVYDADGVLMDNPRVTYSDGSLTIMAHLPTLQANGTVVFDTDSSWNDSLMPVANGDAIIELSGDATITVSGTYTLGSLTITGSGVATFSGEGAITAANISVKNGATFTRNANISATTGISLDSGTVLRLDGVTENAAISGAGAVETYGNVVLAAVNSMTGGITVKSGSSLSTSVEPVWENPSTKAICNCGFGPYNKDSAYSAQSRVTVEAGGCIDINNVANKDVGVALTIAGNGILSDDVYSGAVKYSGTVAIGSNSRQISSLTLTADALVDVGAGWGLVHSGHATAFLNLNGHTLTMRGSGIVPMVKVDASSSGSGVIYLDGSSIKCGHDAAATDKNSNFYGIGIIAKGSATLDFLNAPTALGSLLIKPSNAGTSSSYWHLPEGLVPALDTSNVDPSGLAADDVLTLFTAPSATELTAETIAVKAGGRYTTTISGNTVTATVKALANFMHYDFNAANSIATDSTYNFGNLNPTFVNSKNGKAGVFNNSYKPYYDSNTSGKSPFYAGEMTVTSLLKVKEASNTILWNIGSTGYDSKTGIALIAKDASTLTVVSWVNNSAGSDVVSVTGVDLLNKWHFVTLVASANGTVLYVDDRSEAVSTCLPSGINARGQFGSIHAGAKSYNAVSGDGFLLDDWRVYDAALTAKEVKALKRELNPDPLFIRLR